MGREIFWFRKIREAFDHLGYYDMNVEYLYHGFGQLIGYINISDN
jgi:hypothetical protein